MAKFFVFLPSPLVKRQFSAASWIVTYRPPNLHPSTINNLIFLLSIVNSTGWEEKILTPDPQCYGPTVCGSYDGGKIWLDSSVVRASARYAVCFLVQLFSFAPFCCHTILLGRCRVGDFSIHHIQMD